MAISAISIQQIVAVIRQQMTQPVNVANAPAVAVPRTVRKAGNRTRPRSSDSNKLGKLIWHRVSSLQLEDPERARKAFRIFLEAILINEFGNDLINDPSFYQLVDDVHKQMENNPDLTNLINEASTQLLAGANPAAKISKE